MKSMIESLTKTVKQLESKVHQTPQQYNGTHTTLIIIVTQEGVIFKIIGEGLLTVHIIKVHLEAILKILVQILDHIHNLFSSRVEEKLLIVVLKGIVLFKVLIKG